MTMKREAETLQLTPPVTPISAVAAAAVPTGRRHDLDALRAAAMLLGIAFHVGLAFASGFPWLVQDAHRNVGFLLFAEASHGFRMPLFFLVSGFFTAMLWRRRGVQALLKHRFKRILLPCLLGLVTIVPVMFVVMGLALSSEPAKAAADNAGPSRAEMFDAVVADDLQALETLLRAGHDANALHPQWGISPLMLSALLNRSEAAEALLRAGADVSARGQDGGTALHAAAFLGSADVARVLLEHGAGPEARNLRGESPADVLSVDWPTTRLIAGMLRIPVEEAQVREGRQRVLEELQARGAAVKPVGNGAGEPTVARGTILPLLFNFPVFHHLWFLWFLWWLVLLFSLGFLAADRFGRKGAPAWLVLSPLRFLWLIPLTMLPQSLMGATNVGFGPDTSVGLLPLPHLFFYYALFFGFGVLYFEADDRTGQVGRGWRWLLPVAFLIVFPAALELSTGQFGLRPRLGLGGLERPLANGLQVVFTWMTVFGCMGLFRSLLTRENRIVRWLSDSSYWLYLAHLPLVILAQLWVRSWPLPAMVKFLLLNALIIGFLLITYQWMVRYTWLGTLLNGPRTRPAKTPAIDASPQGAAPLAQS
jgi:peptidoglycan/LPS O-acetylase OafA/YrhL